MLFGYRTDTGTIWNTYCLYMPVYIHKNGYFAIFPFILCLKNCEKS